jgi:hypothetical protein
MDDRDLKQQPDQPDPDWEMILDDIRFLKKNLTAGRYAIPGQMVTTLIDALEQRQVYVIAKLCLNGTSKSHHKQETALKMITRAGIQPRKIATLLRQNRASLCREYCSGGSKCAKKRGYTVQICSLECDKLNHDN